MPECLNSKGCSFLLNKIEISKIQFIFPNELPAASTMNSKKLIKKILQFLKLSELDLQ